MTNDTAFPASISLEPVHAPSGRISVPGSKSLGNRAILLAGIAAGVSRLRGILDADDTDAALSALSALGVAWRRDGDAVTIHGTGGAFPNRETEVDIHSSGTVGRFLPGLLAGTPSGEWRIVATPQLSSRPLSPLVDALRQWGADLRQESEAQSFPLQVRGGGLRGGGARVSARASSQFASGALMAAPLCREPASVAIADLDPEEAYIDLTLDLMRRFGVESESRREGGGQTVDIASPVPYRAADMEIEADANTAMYFLALAALTGGDIAVANLNPASRQPGLKFLDILTRLGCDVIRGDGVAVRGRTLPLRGGFTLDMRAMSEMALTLGVMAVFADAPVTMTNLSHIRGHESDRLAALARLLSQAGVHTEETPDSITVHPQAREKIRNVAIDPHDDHRLAMSFSLLGMAANGVTILNPACTAKTCPIFFDLLGRLGAAMR